MTFEKIKYNFEQGFWTEAMVKMAVRKGVITQAQCDQILGTATEEPKEEPKEEPEADPEEATVEDYLAALEELGVDTSEEG